MGPTIITVSYTHLDVYKRQAKYLSAIHVVEVFAKTVYKDWLQF